MENQNYLGTHELSTIIDKIRIKRKNKEKVASVIEESEKLKKTLATSYIN